MSPSHSPAAQILRVPCPYCPTGGVAIVGFPTGLEEQIKALAAPRQCGECKRYFKFHVRVVVTGVKLPQ